MKIIILLVLLSSCTQSSNKVKNYLELHGDCEKVTDLGWGFLGCGKGDTFNNKFTCVKKGRLFRGNLCSGLFKGNTIRWQ